MPSPLVLVYDAEDARCRRLADWVARRDREGLVVPFPSQNGEVARVAPELAGRVAPGLLLVLDTGTRQVEAGPRVMGPILARLPGWRVLAALGLAGLVFRVVAR
ncbi:thiol-disulfide oxidoreductase DCC family protein [Mesoterricola sediminis]|uniref:DUF393 domain-containing protein n=1 Tax=Mesoterricola sediminis TaxID=2927980 RepID=A0AA48H278_9BACT|nr:hypothetical protein [Mesoterricola sediminis]BDU78630.1 hypothetical protein METESE_35880 [Mesoterricola sediminis]